MPLTNEETLATEVYTVVFNTLDGDTINVDGDTAGAIATVAERVTVLVLEDKPLMIAPRLPDNRERNRVTLMAAIALGAQWVLNVENTYYFFATKDSMNVRLRSLGLPDFDDPDQPVNTPTGPYGSLEETRLHWHT